MARPPFSTSSPKVQSISDADFKAKTSKGLSLVSFKADWCGVCPAIAPTVEKLAVDHATQLNVFRMDVDVDGKKTADHFKINALPTVLVLKNGKEIARIEGSNNQGILAAVDKALR